MVRINLQISDKPKVQSMTVIGSGLPERTDPAALVIGPTGVDLSPDESLLYVADTLANRVAVIENPLDRMDSVGTGTTLTERGFLNGPLGLVVAPDGNILTVNGNDGLIPEITPKGRQVASVQLDRTGFPPGAGTVEYFWQKSRQLP